MRILGITIPNNKHLDVGLTALFGIGISRARAILKEVDIDPNIKADTLTVDQENAIRKVIETMSIEGSLKREIASNVKRLKDIKSYRGVRHMRRLPVNGQRTKTNSRTIRGNVRKTMASGRRKESKT
ncbi:MAG: 30S ribosomal protein S13 [Candidatus Nomurabacteria bacterium GW2011_GWF2_35_66]|uniref:Small ribosomal subunit protein uS13 n=1 Tax=Candidatus Nomurabacteria bacterium GW2011_GWE1_35_16 TaxID=1618761 RepID=A0A0G0BQ43_9BACT|nr:MAG: 30S ribosomal protein S13 [Candidatus Nomurabacteria bacterium GW2011_GWF1_34_20]KKP63345.1 MAG: 30S ribosomal protein S13 [Candidatus Nomurabacteria bacterium GW2011_GWE2_34_25]KKP65746.1 MAG: 30S ribosomal protein S13 [Candidatus Nomurabacteria bacterium GW2011_GWE1_35_16]KKP83582.1 MAG: 30S ribosomal protein S13 [Candidatus Nomurabacteria bacterium GW2011_GWF2_35_66]HAE36844.1 30S ribosomal protein S13 [Candidatus Nomurabacteria bacterium]